MTADAYLKLAPAVRLMMRETHGAKTAPRLLLRFDRATRVHERELATGKAARRNTGGAFGGSNRQKSFSNFGRKGRAAA